MSSSSIQRPSKNGDEDDLLRMQQEFLDNSQRQSLMSVKLIKKNPTNMKAGVTETNFKDVVEMDVNHPAARPTIQTDKNTRKRSKFASQQSQQKGKAYTGIAYIILYN